MNLEIGYWILNFMAVKIRLARFGKTGKPAYRIVAIDEHKQRNGRSLEILGTYDPIANPAKTILNKERINYWISVGAKPTETVAQLIKKS